MVSGAWVIESGEGICAYREVPRRKNSTEPNTIRMRKVQVNRLQIKGNFHLTQDSVNAC
jgi:hypothetical protein